MIMTALLSVAAAVAAQPGQPVSEQVAAIRAAVEAENWDRVRAGLPSVAQHYALSREQRRYLHLVQGLLWQRQGEHRQAMEVYQQFGPDDPFYAEARTNLAIAYLKQDWWTDAHRELEALLASSVKPEAKNRLRIMLGLSQLQQGFYRDARDTFGQLDQDSRYAPFGWRGIGLAALHLQDHAGALNAFRRLRTFDHPELPDGPFLVAFTYDRMNRLTLAQASYQEAQLHYQSRIQQLDRQLETSPDNQALARRREQLDTLLSQCQYGLATIYDRQ